MRSMQLFQPAPIEQSPLQLAEFLPKRPEAGQVLLRVRACGVCHTDLHIVEGEVQAPAYPLIPGHQVVGEVAAVGSGVSWVKLGERVGLAWLYSACGECGFCRRGEENLCLGARFTGLHVPGGFADYLLAEESFLLPLPLGISDIQAAPLLCAGIIGYRSLRKADVHPGERLGLFGFGASAHLAIQIARYWQCEVYVFTRSEAHRQHALELGAAWVGGAEDRPPLLLDRAVIFAPNGALVPLALEKIRRGGTLAINAIHMSPIPQMQYATIYGERTLRSVMNATRQDGLELLRLAVEIPLQVTAQPYALEDANRALDDLKHSRINGEAVLHLVS